MNEKSIFDKIFNEGQDKNLDKENKRKEVLASVYKEIDDLESKKQSILKEKQNLDELLRELKDKRGEFKSHLETLLTLFSEEENKSALAEKGIYTVNDLILSYEDTEEVQKMVESETRIKELVQTIKDLKEGLSIEHDIENPEYSKHAENLSALLHWKTQSLNKEKFQLWANTPEGRENWPVNFDYHKKDSLEEVFDNKLPAIREVYHKIADYIDQALREAVEEFNKKRSSDQEEVTFKDPERYEFINLSDRFSIHIEDENKISLYFLGHGFTKKHIELIKSDGAWRAKDLYGNIQMLADEDDFVRLWNSKLSNLNSYVESLANSEIG
ncbi:hypothetical protein KC842_02835 [Candidatus Nomurabacteria bacterium]|nr:hypothetical protein [Candidatus Nomurabacteria bacterium]